MRGIKRVKQFYKVEMVRIVEPDDSMQHLEELVADAEAVLQRLELPYQVMLLCTGDLGFAMTKTYDLNAWAAGSGEWLEVSSISNANDYQARRANIRFRREAGGRTEYPHTLNGSGLALPRTMIAILENNQQADGSVIIPKALRPYMGGHGADHSRRAELDRGLLPSRPRWRPRRSPSARGELDDLQKIVALCKRRGFVFPSAEIYGGFANTYDYGPLGVLLKNNVRDAWIRSNVQRRDDVELLDAALITSPKVWVASGHVNEFNDPLVQCLGECKSRYRADQVDAHEVPELRRPAQRAAHVQHHVQDPGWPRRRRREHRLFAARNRAGHLRQLRQCRHDHAPETAVWHRPGAASRSGTRSRPATSSSARSNSSRWSSNTSSSLAPTKSGSSAGSTLRERWYLDLGIRPENLRRFEHPAEKLSHYSKRTVDIEYRFPFGEGWGELEGIANRSKGPDGTSWDLWQHEQFSGQRLTLFDEEKKQHVRPGVVEPAAGLTRAALTFLIDAYEEQVLDAAKNDMRTVLHLHPALAPVQGLRPAAVSATSPTWCESRASVYEDLRRRWMITYDSGSNIGKLYRRQDEIGTPFCITVDFQTLEDNKVTIRDRDSMDQSRFGRVPIAELRGWLEAHLDY